MESRNDATLHAWGAGHAHALNAPLPLVAETPKMDRAPVIGWLRKQAPGFILELAVNFAAPVLIYDQMHDRVGDVPALLASSAPPLIWSVIYFWRNRHIDAISILSLVGIALSILAFFGGGSAQLLQLREKMVTLLIGLAFLGSAAIGKPLIYPLARATVARESADRLVDFDAKRNDPLLRHTVMVMTLAWGLGLVADVGVSAVLIYSLSVTEYLIIGPIVGYATIGGLTLWTILYRRYRTRHAAMIRARSSDEGNHDRTSR